MSTVIYSVADLATDTHVRLERVANPYGMWHVSISTLTRIFPSHEVTYDSLVDAANAVILAVDNFEDDDAPSMREAADAIANHFHDDKIYRGEDDEFIWLVNEYEWDEEDEDEN